MTVIKHVVQASDFSSKEAGIKKAIARPEGQDIQIDLPAIVHSGPKVGRSGPLAASGLWKNISWRLALVYGLWGALQWPVLIHIYKLMGLWNIYVVCLVAPLLSWHGSLEYYRKQSVKVRAVNTKLVFVAAAAMICAFLSMHNLPVSALFSVSSLFIFRTALTGESLGKTMVAGGAILLFMIPLPLAFLEDLSSRLSHLQGSFVPVIFEPLTGIPMTSSGDMLTTSLGHGIQVARECSGARSLVSLLMFAVYYANCKRHNWAGILLVSAAAAALAILLNQLRLVFSCLFYVAGNLYWSSESGHQLLGLIIIALGLVLIRALARNLFIEEDTDPAGIRAPSQLKAAQ